MRKTIILYGISLAVLVFILKLLEYQFFVRDLSMEIYIGAVAVLFTIIGVWAGRNFVGRKAIPTAPPQSNNVPDISLKPEVTHEAKIEKFGISPREYEVLQLIAEGHSNQEIADKLFVSLSTIKTHSSNLFLKLDVKRRTQAVIKARELRLIP